jgi:hypothetical protein
VIFSNVIPGRCAAANPEPINTCDARYDRLPEDILLKFVFMGSGSRPADDPGMTVENKDC